MPRCELYTSSVATAFGWQLLVQEIHGMAAWHELRSGMKVRMQDFYVFFPLNSAPSPSLVLVHRCAPVGPIFGSHGR